MTPETADRVNALMRDLFATCQRHAQPGHFNLDVMACAVMLVSFQIARDATMQGRRQDIENAINAAVAIFSAFTGDEQAEVERVSASVFEKLGIKVAKEEPT